MRNTGFLILTAFFMIFALTPNTFTQDYTKLSLPEGAKARLGKGYKTGSSLFSEDGTRFTVASSIGLWVYDIFTGQEVALLKWHPSNFTVIASSPDSSILASGYENTISLWEIHTDRRIAQLTEHSENITTLIFSPDGKVLASASEDNTIRLWDTTTGKLLFLPLSEHTGDVISIAFSPDSKMLASGSTDNSVRLWSVTTGQHLATLEEQVAWGVVTHEGHTGDVTAVAFSPDGATLASGGTDNKIRLWNIGAREHRTVLTGHSENVTALAFSMNGAMLVSAGADNTLQLWNTSTGRRLDILEGHEDDVVVLAFSPDGATLASGDAGDIARLWDGNAGQHLGTLSLSAEVYGNPIRAVTFSPDGITLASGDGFTESQRHLYTSPGYCGTANYTTSTLYRGSTQLWNTLTGERRSRLTGDGLPFVDAVAFSPDGSTFARTGQRSYLRVNCSGLFRSSYIRVTERSILLWNSLTDEDPIYLKLNGRIYSIVFSPDGKILAGGSEDNTIRLWNPTTGQYLTTFRGHSGEVNSVAFSADGETLASGSNDDTIKLWNSNGEFRATLSGHADDVRTVAFSPDGKILASGSEDNTIQLWNPTTAKHIATLEGHTDWVRSVAFSPDGGTLASASDDRTIRLWDSATGQHFATLSGHTGYVYSIAFSPDGTTLASGSGDGTILFWEIEPAVSQNPLDVNGDGVINILDLAAVAANFGQTGQNPADVNGDGIVNVNDIVLVAGALGNALAAPSISPQILETLTVADVQKWLTDAKQLKFTDTARQRGITVLEQLLEVLMHAETIPTETALLPNYPNPFNPETWIPYQLSEAADVTMTLYAVDGRLVRTLELGYQSAGVYHGRTHAAYWDGRNEFGEPVASGIYFYTLTAGEFTATRKMLIRK